MYPAPQNRVLRWVAEIGADLPDLVQQRLRAAFFTSSAPLVVGAINTIAVASVAYFRSGQLMLAVIALADLFLLVLRVQLLRRVEAPSGPIFATGLLWSCLQGTTIAIVVTSSDDAMSIIALASGFAAIGGIIGRNFAAPRYAMAQVLIVDFSYKISFSTVHPEFVPLILIQSVAFILMNRGILRQHRKAAIQAILGEMESHRQSVTDPLTGLVNRRGLEEAFATSKADAAGQTLFYLDLDGFKQVNDSFGHAAGDTLLREVGRRLRETAGSGATACRLGGDEFLLLAGHLDGQEAQRLATRIIATIDVPYQLGDGLPARVGVSIGIADDEAGTLELPDMMLKADRALYAAKASGKGRCILHGDAGATLDHAA